MQINH